MTCTDPELKFGHSSISNTKNKLKKRAEQQDVYEGRKVGPLCTGGDTVFLELLSFTKVSIDGVRFT